MASGSVYVGVFPAKLIRRSIVIAIVAAVLTAAFSLMMPNQYVAQSGLLLQPPPVIPRTPARGGPIESASPAEQISFLMVKPLTIKDYSALLVCDELVSALRARFRELLAQAGQPDKEIPIESFRRKMKVETRVLSQTSSEVVYQPIMALQFEGERPEIVAEIANAWADLGIKMSADISKKGEEGLVGFLEGRFQGVSQDLDEKEKSLETLESEWDVVNTEARLKDANAAATKYDIQRIDLETEIAETQSALGQVKTDISGETEKKTLRKAPPDDAYWLLDATKQPPDTSKVMVTEEMSQTYLKLREQETTLQQKLAGTTKKKEELEQKVSELRAEIAQLQTKQADYKRRQSALKRDVDTYTEQYKRLAENREAARTAQEQTTPVLKLAYKAVMPETKTGPKRSLMVVAAALIGACIAPAHFAASRSLRALSKPTDANGDA